MQYLVPLCSVHCRFFPIAYLKKLQTRFNVDSPSCSWTAQWSSGHWRFLPYHTISMLWSHITNAFKVNIQIFLLTRVRLILKFPISLMTILCDLNLINIYITSQFSLLALHTSPVNVTTVLDMVSLEIFLMFFKASRCFYSAISGTIILIIILVCSHMTQAYLQICNAKLSLGTAILLKMIQPSPVYPIII